MEPYTCLNTDSFNITGSVIDLVKCSKKNQIEVSWANFSL